MSHYSSSYNSLSPQSLGRLAAISALALLTVAGAKAETFPAVPASTLPAIPTKTLPPAVTAPAAASQLAGKPRLASPGMPFAGLRLLAQDGVSLLYTNQGGYGFGTVNPLDTPKVQAVFHLKNDTDKPITLDRFQPSCHCTTAAVEGAPAGAALPTLPAGGQVSIRVTVDLAGHPSGNLEKMVSVYTVGHTQPAAVLAMEGVLMPLVALTPSLLDFGTVRAGKEKILPITLTIDPRLATGGKLPELLSSNGSLRLVPQPTIVTLASQTALGKTITAKATGDVPKTITRTYNAILSANAPIGPVNGTLSFAPSRQTDPVAAQAFTGGSVLLLGQVQGEVNALPQSLSFGTIKQGEEAIRQIALLGNQTDDVKDLSVASPSPYVSAKLMPLSPSFGVGGQIVTNARTLVVTLSRDAPSGTVQTQLKVSLASGRRLIVPISAYVTAPISY